MINRRDLLKAGALALPLTGCQSAGCPEKSNGLPPLTIKDVKVITTNGGSRYHWVFLKIITSEPSPYGIGSANDDYQVMEVTGSIECMMAGASTASIHSVQESERTSTRIDRIAADGPIHILWAMRARLCGHVEMPVRTISDDKGRVRKFGGQSDRSQLASTRIEAIVVDAFAVGAK